MKDRIKLIMEKENLPPAKFADKLQVNRAVISHILNGRNNPSLDVVTKILGEMDYINAEWLISGSGDMYKEGYNPHSRSASPDLLNQDHLNHTKVEQSAEKPRETAFKPVENEYHLSENKAVIPQKKSDRKITQIIIYYDDSTFEIFGPHLK